MKKISILAIGVIAVLVCVVLFGAVKGVINGWNSVGSDHDHTHALVTLTVEKTDAGLAVDSVYNTALNEYVPLHVSKIKTYIQEPLWLNIIPVAFLLIGPLVLYGIYCLIRLLISVTRKEVFIRMNVRRMRIFVYGVILAAIIVEVQLYGSYLTAVSQLQLPGYEVGGYSMKTPWLYMLLLALFTEIFAAGVHIKEEQDLTI